MEQFANQITGLEGMKELVLQQWNAPDSSTYKDMVQILEKNHDLLEDISKYVEVHVTGTRELEKELNELEKTDREIEALERKLAPQIKSAPLIKRRQQ